MDIFDTIKEAICEILDIENGNITRETYLIRELDAESIDLLELGVVLNSNFGVRINDDEMFLGSLRMHIEESSANGETASSYLNKKYPYLSPQRISEILEDVDGGPVLKIKDIISYISSKL